VREALFEDGRTEVGSVGARAALVVSPVGSVVGASGANERTWQVEPSSVRWPQTGSAWSSMAARMAAASRVVQASSAPESRTMMEARASAEGPSRRAMSARVTGRSAATRATGRRWIEPVCWARAGRGKRARADETQKRMEQRSDGATE